MKENLILILKIVVSAALLYSIWTVVKTQHLAYDADDAPAARVRSEAPTQK